MTPFKKLKIKIDITEPIFGNPLYAFGKNQSIEFFKVPIIIETYLLNIIPDQYKECFKSSIMKINTKQVRPHTDSDRIVGINFYIKSANASTMFFNKKEHTYEGEKVVGQTNGSVYNHSDLIFTDMFSSVDGDIWILDVTKVHSVFVVEESPRIAYTLSSNILSYCNTLKILNHLL